MEIVALVKTNEQLNINKLGVLEIFIELDEEFKDYKAKE